MTTDHQVSEPAPSPSERKFGMIITAAIVVVLLTIAFLGMR